MLGRVKVRIIALHTDDKAQLPTADLPWATVMGTINSAALSGVGQSPTGILAGSWVCVVFLDGNSCQVPLVIGTIGGIPQGGVTQDAIGDNTPQPFYKIGDADTPPATTPEDVKRQIPAEQGGGQIPAPPEAAAAGTIGPLDDSDYMKLREAIAEHESRGNGDYSARNSLGYIGRYQFGAPALESQKYVRKGTTNKDLGHREAWLGKNGISSREDWLANHAEQDKAMFINTQNNFKYLRNKGTLRNDSDKKHVAGALMAAHLKGAGGANKYIKSGVVTADANGTTIASYYTYGHASLSGELPKQMPTDETALPLAVATGEAKGFADPNAKYPKRTLLQESDTNRMARAERVADTIVGTKELNRAKNVRIAGTQAVWDQPHIPYAAMYPYNQVRATEGGIVEEFDSTKNAERYHLYHPAGTYTEIDANGTQVNRIVGDQFTILERDGNVVIRGNCNITIEGEANILAQHNCAVEVYGDMNAIVKNNMNTTVHGKSSMYVEEDFSIKCKTFNVETFGGDINLLSSKNIDTKCAEKFTIDATKDITVKSIENLSMDISKALSFSSGENTTIVSAADVQTSGMRVSVAATTTIDMDGAAIYTQSGTASSPAATKVSATDTITLKGTYMVDGVETPLPLPATPQAVIITGRGAHYLARQELTKNDIAVLTPPPTRFHGIANRHEGDADDYDHAAVTELKEKAEYDTEAADPTPTDSHGGFDVSGVNDVVDYPYENFTNETEIPKGVQISPNYSLQQFLLASDGVKRVVAQHGLSEGEIVQNIHYLAVNIVEKVKELYPSVHITSGFRYAKGASLHERGQAVDLQFTGVDPSGYFDIAKKLATALPFDKILLEYKNYSTQMPWIHIQYRHQSNRGEVYTFFNNKKYANDLVKLA
jgi:hypothetical protein